MNFQLVKVLDLATLIWYKMTGKCALQVTRGAIEKKNYAVKVFEIFSECCLQY